MCGIAGFAGNFSPSLLEEMGEAISHRGPDAHGQILLKNPTVIGLAHRRLSILDLSPNGHQPMTLNCSRCCALDNKPENKIWLSYNGEIYNFAEIKKDLLESGHQFQSKTDTEVLLHLYAEEGLDFLKKLNGIFALAIYDGTNEAKKRGVEKGDLILARDGLGVKPLYYSELPEGILFGSELKSLLQSDEMPRDLDLVSIRMYLSYLYAPTPHTPFQKAKKLEPGHFLVVRNKKIVQKKAFYDIPYGQQTLPGSASEIADTLRQKLKSAVGRQLMSDVPVGAFLSGGMDSSSIVALMQQAQPETQFRCFTIGDGQQDLKNDLYYAKSIAKSFSLDLSVVEVRPADFDLLQKVIYHLDEPQADAAAINSYLICQQASKDGIKVLMSGSGGDDIFSGYTRHAAGQTELFLDKTPLTIRKTVAHLARKIASHHGGTAFIKHNYLRKTLKVLSNIDEPQSKRLSSYLLNSSAASINPLLGDPFTTANEDILYPLLHSLEKVAHEPALLNKMLYLDTKFFLADHNLNYVDKTSMAHGVEVRVPILDLEVVNFAARIPASLKRHGMENKYIFKKSVEKLLPQEIYNRKKQGFGLPLKKWLQTELADVVQDTLSAKSIQNRGLFQPAAVQNLLKQNQSQNIEASSPILALMCFELWCRTFLDSKGKTERLSA